MAGSGLNTCSSNDPFSLKLPQLSPLGALLNSIKSIFWNNQEERLRMAWRLLFQTMLMTFFLVINQIFGYLFYSLFSVSNLNIPTDGSIAYSSTQLLFATFSTGLALVFSIWISGKIFDRRRFSNFGFRLNTDWWVDFAFGLALGAFLMLLIFILELTMGWISIQDILVTQNPAAPFFATILIPLAIFLFVGFYEELLNRGYYLTNLAEGFSGKFFGPRGSLLFATIFSSIIFGFMHAANPNSTFTSFVNISLAGLFLATGYLLTGQLAIPIGLHISWNFFQGNVFGFPVSGGGYGIATFIKIAQEGPDLWTGGAFGPEGGLLGTITSFLGIICIAAWIKYRSGTLNFHLAISEPPRRKFPKTKVPDLEPSLSSSPDTSEQLISELSKYSHVIWDWNGTLLDDLQLCLDVINEILSKRQLPKLTKEKYLKIFGFPVKDYYLKLGFDFDQEPFEVVSAEFIKAYELGRQHCKLMPNAKDILITLSSLGLSQSILSASKQSYLDKAIEHYGLRDFFCEINGLDNHHASGKADIAIEFMTKHNIAPSNILLIGDTTHDAEIARTIGVDCWLIPDGHQSRQRLKKLELPMINSLGELNQIVQKSRLFPR